MNLDSLRTGFDLIYVLVLRSMTPRRCDLVSVVLISLGTNLFSSMLVGEVCDYVHRVAFYSFFSGVCVFLLGASLEETYSCVKNAADDHASRHSGEYAFFKFAFDRVTTKTTLSVVSSLACFFLFVFCSVMLVFIFFQWHLAVSA